MVSPFSEIGVALWKRGYSPIPIMPHNAPVRGRGKAPGHYVGGTAGWVAMKEWDDFCIEQPSIHKVRAWSRMTDQFGGGVGVACGRGLICIDIDQEEIIEPLMAILPPSDVQKKGRKGISLFYQGNTEVIRSKNYRTPDRVGLVDLLAEGKQTVLPPSIHPDTGEPYFWWTDETLLDVGVAALSVLPDDIADRIGEVLRAFGYDPDGDRPVVDPSAQHAHSMPRAAGGGSIYRKCNDDALGSLHAWVPELHLIKWRSKPGGFEAVAHWRSSSTGRSLQLRKRNLSIVAKGIEDFGTGEKFTPIDLVMKALGCNKNVALNWLIERLPRDPLIFQDRKY
ncbi:bifunctional DNA primase/polymerase [Bradyrhizobium sp. SZCCHNPS2010]|uniref:bifunctional DNA primase/polymerase n=1 Tax=Bradyrhizobium sp. SZCCHNPS2010 TaxID=3057333 RepID=UPI002915EBB9|nr:bifunctional DNA primase/polymerase [Bradyrhizobium sp. SZCCHNPS2010]